MPDCAATTQVITHLRAAGETNLTRDDTVPPNLHVVRHMDEVIHLRPLSDHGRAERPTVDARIGSDLDIVLDDDITDLQNLAVTAFV